MKIKKIFAKILPLILSSTLIFADDVEVEKMKNIAAGLGDLTDAQVEYQCQINFQNGKDYLTDFQYINYLSALEKLEEAKKYETQKLWIHALGTYYDLIENDSSVNSVAAYNSFQNLASILKSGKPGPGKFSNAELKKSWNDLQLEFEQYWLEKTCVYVEKPVSIKTMNDKKNGTVVVEKFEAINSKKYETISAIVKTGYGNAWKNDWKDLDSQWLDYRFANIDFVCRYLDFENIVTDGNYVFEFVLVDSNGNNIFGDKKFQVNENQVYYIENVSDKNLRKCENAKVKITNWGYRGQHKDFISIDLDDLKFSNDDSISLIELDIEKKNNASKGLGRISDEQVKNEKEKNKINLLGDITDAEVKTQREKNQKAGLGFITDFQVEAEKVRNKTSGAGDITNAQGAVQRAVNKRAKLGEVTDTHLATRNAIMSSLIMVDMPERNYQMQKTEVTQKIYEAVMGENPSVIVNENFPVENISWYDIIVFCNRLSEVYGLEPIYSVDGSTDTMDWNYTPHQGQILEGDLVENIKATGFRLPAQGEWIYAANGGQNFNYSGSDSFDEVAWNSDNQHEVGQKKPNGFGLYDMSGNVDEWWWTANGDFRCYSDYSIYHRHYVNAETRYGTVGFRVMKLKDGQ